MVNHILTLLCANIQNYPESSIICARSNSSRMYLLIWQNCGSGILLKVKNAV